MPSGVTVVNILIGVRITPRPSRQWIGDRQGHRRTDFDQKSVAYQVVEGTKNSPFFTTLESANQQGQDRGDKSYSSFYVFRLNQSAVLSLDWPKKIEENDDYISVARRLLYLDVAPAIGKLLDNWHDSLASEVNLQPLSANQATAGLTVAPPQGTLPPPTGLSAAKGTT